jgi:hypothetical protein
MAASQIQSSIRWKWAAACAFMRRRDDAGAMMPARLERTTGVLDEWQATPLAAWIVLGCDPVVEARFLSPMASFSHM